MEPKGWFVGLVMVACAVGALGAFAGGGAGNSPSVELSLQGIVRVRSGQHVAILAEKSGVRRLPIPVSRDEASLIDHAAHGSGGLLGASLEALGGRVVRASIDGVSSDGKLRGHLALKNGAGEVRVEAGAGEALALALQAGAPVVVSSDVLDEAGISLDDLRGRTAGSKRRELEPAPVLDI